MKLLCVYRLGLDECLHCQSQVVHHEINCFFDMPVFTNLVEDKWQKFGYRMHVHRVLIYAFFVIVTTFALGEYFLCIVPLFGMMIFVEI